MRWLRGSGDWFVERTAFQLLLLEVLDPERCVDLWFGYGLARDSRRWSRRPY